MEFVTLDDTVRVVNFTLASEAAPHRGARVRAGARASLAAASFSDANVPSAVADDFVSCNRTAESFLAKCAAFLDDAAFFPAAARTAAFPFGYSRNLTAPRWCGMAWALAKNCLDQVPPPSRAERKAMRSRSRSTTMRTATDCTRPADFAEAPILRHSTSETSQP